MALSSAIKPLFIWRILLRTQWVFVLFVFSTSVLLSPVLLRPTFIRGYDSPFHIYNSQRFINELQSGVWYPRWFGDWFGGYGAPVGVGYPPLTYYSAAALAGLGFTTLAALKVILWVSLFVSGLAMYKLAYQFMQPVGALAAGLYYQVAPYYIFDLYGRTALSEYVAFMWLPPLFSLALYCIREKRLYHHLGLAITIAALILTHVLTAYMVAPILVLFSVYIILRHNYPLRSTALRLIAAAGLGILLVTGYVLPAFVENRYMNLGGFLGENGWGDYRNNFLFNAQIYLGTSLEEVFNANAKIGIGAIFSMVFTALALILNVVYWRRRNRLARETALVMTAVSAFSLFMSFNVSLPLWTVLPYADLVQFPWRWQLITSLATAYLVGDALAIVFLMRLEKQSSRGLHRLGLPLMMMVAMGLCILYDAVIIYSHSRRYDEQRIGELLGQQPLSLSYYRRVYADEYLPREHENFDYVATPAREQPVVISDPPAEIEIEQWRSQQRAFIISTPRAATVNVRTFWFPGWRIEVNGENTVPEIHQDDGTMVFPVPAGRSQVVLAFEDTPIRSVSMMISAGSALVLLGLTVKCWREILIARGSGLRGSTLAK